MGIQVHELVPIENIAVAKDLVVTALKNDACKVKVESNNRLTAKRGSQLKLRALGGMVVGLKVLPVKIEVDFVEIDNQGQLEISAFDDLGIGSMMGMEEKYRKAVLDIVETVISSVSKVTVTGLETSENLQPKLQKSFCSQCGEKVDLDSKFCSKCGSPL